MIFQPNYTSLLMTIESLKAQLIANQINMDAHNNAIRKLNEANTRIVEFEDIKKGHLKVQKDMLDLLKESREALLFFDNDHTTDIVKKLDSIIERYGR